MEFVWTLFMLFGFGKHNGNKWRATLMRRQGAQGAKRRSSFEAKYLVLDVLLHKWIFLWLLSRESTLEQVCLEVFGFRQTRKGLSSTVVYISIIFVLSTYLAVDFFKQHSYEFRSASLSEADQAPSKFAATAVSAATAASGAVSTQPAEDDICSSVFGHLLEHRSSQQQEAGPWDQMKWIGKPARCRVKGELIENLDERYTFRCGYSLKFTADVED
jgi:hypothetical protein